VVVGQIETVSHTQNAPNLPYRTDGEVISKI